MRFCCPTELRLRSNKVRLEYGKEPYDKWRDRTGIDIPPDGVAGHLWSAIDRAEQDAVEDSLGLERTARSPIPMPEVISEAGLEMLKKARTRR